MPESKIYIQNKHFSLPNSPVTITKMIILQVSTTLSRMHQYNDNGNITKRWYVGISDDWEKHFIYGAYATSDERSYPLSGPTT